MTNPPASTAAAAGADPKTDLTTAGPGADASVRLPTPMQETPVTQKLSILMKTEFIIKSSARGAGVNVPDKVRGLLTILFANATGMALLPFDSSSTKTPISVASNFPSTDCNVAPHRASRGRSPQRRPGGANAPPTLHTNLLHSQRLTTPSAYAH